MQEEKKYVSIKDTGIVNVGNMVCHMANELRWIRKILEKKDK